MTKTQVAKIEKRETARAEPTAPNHVSPFERYADEIAPKFILGELLKFSKGDWLIGEEEIVPNDTVVLPILDGLLAGFVRWSGGKPTEQVMMRVGSGQRLPRRGELGDTDQDYWDTDDKGEKRDPWQFTNYLPLIVLDGARLLTFTTSSSGGKAAVAQLSRRYANHQKSKPNDFPLAQLGIDSYLHPNRAYGRIKVPDLRPAGYLKRAQYDALLMEVGLVEASEQTTPERTKLPATEFGAETEDPVAGMSNATLDDEIPF
jgi:hypothetical protein